MIVAGLDLGWKVDFSAFVVADDSPDETVVLELDRWKAREDLADVPARVAPALERHRPAGLAFDATGLGRHFAPTLLRGVGSLVPVYPIAATHGWRPARQRPDGDRAVFCPKRDLVRALFSRLQARRLRVPACTLAGALKQEIAGYQETTGPDGLPRWGARPPGHDDLVAASSLACWLADALRDRGAGGFRAINAPEERWSSTNSGR